MSNRGAATSSRASDLEAALLSAKKSARVSPIVKENLIEKVARFENAIAHAFKDKDEKVKDAYLELSSEQLVELYNSADFQDLSAFQKLMAIHKVAPHTIHYDPSKPLENLIKYSGTGLELAFHRPDFWILFLFHVVLSLTYFGLGHTSSGGNPSAPGWPPVNVGLVAIPGGLITFIIVFYLNQTFGRYLTIHHHVTATCGLLGEFVQLCRVHLGDNVFPEARAVRHLLCRQINALHFLAYSSLPHNKEVNIHEWAWWFLLHSNLLKEEQVAVLKPLQSIGNGTLVYKEVMMWTNRGVWAQESKGYIEPRVASLFTYKLWEARVHLDALYSHTSGPVPFAYYHLLNFVVLVYLFMLAYVFVFVSPYWSIPGFFLILVSLLGIRELGNSMSNPLGYDKMDIPVFHDLWIFLNESTLLINKDLSYPDEMAEMTPPEKFKAVGWSNEGREISETGEESESFL